jgi:hypothetical protein
MAVGPLLQTILLGLHVREVIMDIMLNKALKATAWVALKAATKYFLDTSSTKLLVTF